MTSLTYPLVGSAVTQLARRSLGQLIHVEPAAVAHLDVVAPVAAVVAPVITNLPRHHSLRDRGVLAVKPAGGMGTTAVLDHTGGGHELASGSREAVPFGGQLVITKHTVPVGHQSVGIAQQGERFAFGLSWKKKSRLDELFQEWNEPTVQRKQSTATRPPCNKEQQANGEVREVKSDQNSNFVIVSSTVQLSVLNGDFDWMNGNNRNENIYGGIITEQFSSLRGCTDDLPTGRGPPEQ